VIPFHFLPIQEPGPLLRADYQAAIYRLVLAFHNLNLTSARSADASRSPSSVITKVMIEGCTRMVRLSLPVAPTHRSIVSSALPASRNLPCAHGGKRLRVQLQEALRSHGRRFTGERPSLVEQRTGEKNPERALKILDAVCTK
jgi:hypothetical protein